MKLLPHAKRWLKKNAQLPNNLIFFVTNICNMKCEHCFYWEDLNVKTNDLTLDEIDKVTKSIGPQLHVVLTGGEPYLRKDIDEIIALFHKNTGCELFTIPSNGYYTERMLEKLEKVLSTLPKVSIMQDLSFDGIGLEHDKIRKYENAYNKAIETSQKLRQLKKKYHKLNLGAIITFTSTNQDHFKDIVEGVHKAIEPDSIFINLVRGNPKEKVNLNLDLQKYKEAVEFRNSLYATGKMKGYQTFPLHPIPQATRKIVNQTVYDTFKGNKYQMPCYAGRLQAVLYPNGDVFPCELLEDKLGNVRDVGYDFAKIWFGQKAEKARKWIWDTNCFCTHECFITTNVTFNPTKMPQILGTAASEFLKQISQKIIRK